jgi:hypothetical protein
VSINAGTLGYPVPWARVRFVGMPSAPVYTGFDRIGPFGPASRQVRIGRSADVPGSAAVNVQPRDDRLDCRLSAAF